jgi:polyphosphate kinase
MPEKIQPVENDGAGRNAARDRSNTVRHNSAEKPLAKKKTAEKKSATKKLSIKKAALKKPAAAPFPEERFFDRDESWMLFNQRVLEEAEDTTNPLIERAKFLAITASNLDEFIEIRVASLLQRIEDGYNQPVLADESGLTPQQRLDRLSVLLHRFVDAQYECWNRKLLPALRAQKIRLLNWRELDERARAHALHFYQTEVDPLLTPVTIDPSHPFPRVLNKAMCIALLLRSKRKSKSSPKPGKALGVVTVPRALPRLVPVPSKEGHYDFILLHKLIESQADGMFRGYEVLSRTAFRVTRNSNLYLQEEESRSVLESVRAELYNRPNGDRRAATHQLRAGRVAGLPLRRSGQPVAADVALQPDCAP